MTDSEIEQKIRDDFETNYEMLRLEGGHPLAPDGKENALNQVLYYWRKMKAVAERISETEVKLSLPELRTPEGRKFAIEGIVDIIREDNETWMYDIKTHDADYVKSNIDLYRDQLNIYAHIWQNLRQQPLNHTAIIATSFPAALANAIKVGDRTAIEHHLGQWNPLIDVPLEQSKVEQIVTEFGKVVDKIENREYCPPALGVLKGKLPGDSQAFATRVCRNCDARFSCSSFREYAVGSNPRSVSTYRKYINDLGDDTDVEDWKSVNLEHAVISKKLEEIPQAKPVEVASEEGSKKSKSKEKVNVQSGSISFVSLFSYIKNHPDIPHKLESEYAPYKSLYHQLVEKIADIPGWYVWVDGSGREKKIVYIGQSQSRKTSTVRERIREEFLDEYVALWGTVHDPKIVEQALDRKYKGKYSQDIARAARKAGSTHLIWIGTEKLTDDQLTTIEYNLIEKLEPSANLKQTQYPTWYPNLLKSVEEKINEELSNIKTEQF